MKKNTISVIYHQENDTPKYVEIKKSKIYFYTIALPFITVICLVLATWTFVQNSPMLIWERYKQVQQTQKGIHNNAEAISRVDDLEEENEKLQKELRKLVESQQPTNTENIKVMPLSTPGLANLGFFKPVTNQQDLTVKKVLNLSGFSVSLDKNKLNFNFNIIPTQISDEKVSGFIIVFAKYENHIFSYPEQITNQNEFLADYTLGETFSTQRFRPVEATFPFPQKSGEYPFKIFIFNKTGDLIHVQQVSMKVKL